MAYESLIGNWSDGAQFYNMRRKYMLERVEDAYNDRNIGSKMGNSQVEKQGMDDAASLRDDTPKSGKAVSLLRNSGEVTDALIKSFDAVARQDTASTSTPDALGLTNVRSILGRADGVSPNATTTYVSMITPGSDTASEVPQTTYNYALSSSEIAKLKSQSAQSLLDKFFGVDTSKY